MCDTGTYMSNDMYHTCSTHAYTQIIRCMVNKQKTRTPPTQSIRNTFLHAHDQTCFFQSQRPGFMRRIGH